MFSLQETIPFAALAALPAPLNCICGGTVATLDTSFHDASLTVMRRAVWFTYVHLRSYCVRQAACCSVISGGRLKDRCPASVEPVSASQDLPCVRSL